jgi:hypothetical protein
MGEETFKYEWLLTYTAILDELLVDLGKECTCKKMTATSDWEFRCMVHPPKSGLDCCPTDYFTHNLESFQNLLNHRSFYCDRSDIKGRSVLVFI